MVSSRKRSIRWPSWARRRRLCAWSGTVALLFQLVLPLMLGMPAAFFAGGNGGAAPVIICDLMDGNMGGDAGASKENGPNHDNPFSSCPICKQFRSISQNFLPAQPAAMPMPLYTAFVCRKPPDFGAAAGRTITGKHPRAPPSAA